MAAAGDADSSVSDGLRVLGIQGPAGRHGHLEEACQKDAALILISGGHILPEPRTSLQPRDPLGPRSGSLAWQERGGTGPPGAGNKVSCLHLPFTMHLLLQWKYKPLRLMPGIRL